MQCLNCETTMNMDSKGICSCITCGYRESQNPEYQPASTVGEKFDKGKLRYSLIPPIATKALAEVLTFGAQKYAPNDWMKVPNAKERYLDALIRHLEAYRSGELIDSDSSLPHLAHLMTHAAFLLHFNEGG
jgi:hypothetical protein